MPRPSRLSQAAQIRQKGNNLVRGLMSYFGSSPVGVGLEQNPVYGGTPEDLADFAAAQPNTGAFDARNYPLESPYTLNTQEGLKYWGRIQDDLRKQLMDREKFVDEQKAKAVFEAQKKQDLPNEAAIAVRKSIAEQAGFSPQPSAFKLNQFGDLPDVPELGTYSNAKQEKFNAEQITDFNRKLNEQEKLLFGYDSKKLQQDLSDIETKNLEGQSTRRTLAAQLRQGYPEAKVGYDIKKLPYLPLQGGLYLGGEGNPIFFSGSETTDIPKSVEFATDAKGKISGGKITEASKARGSVVRELPISGKTQSNTISIPDDAKLSTEGLTPEEIKSGIRIYQGKKVRPKQ